MSSSCATVMLATTMAARAAGDAVELTQGHDGPAVFDRDSTCACVRTCGACGLCVRTWETGLATAEGTATPSPRARPAMTTSARCLGIRSVNPPTMEPPVGGLPINPPDPRLVQLATSPHPMAARAQAFHLGAVGATKPDPDFQAKFEERTRGSPGVDGPSEAQGP